LANGSIANKDIKENKDISKQKIYNYIYQNQKYINKDIFKNINIKIVKYIYINKDIY